MINDDREFLEQLLVEHTLLNDAKFERRMERMDRMQKFYKEKSELAPEGQSFLFIGFVNALQYAITIMHQYRSLTLKIHKKVEGIEDDTKDDTSAGDADS